MVGQYTGSGIDPSAVIIGAVLIGLVPAAIAHGKGGSFLGWWIFGAALFIVALPLAIVMKPNPAAQTQSSGLRRCPFCAEWVQPQAVVCRFCHRDLPPVGPTRISDGEHFVLGYFEGLSYVVWDKASKESVASFPYTVDGWRAAVHAFARNEPEAAKALKNPRGRS